MKVFTIKLPNHLLKKLDEASDTTGESKGALVREALKKYLSEVLEQVGFKERFNKITKAMMQGKKPPKSDVDWDELRRKAQVDTGMTPEEEVRYHRMGRRL